MNKDTTREVQNFRASQTTCDTSILNMLLVSKSGKHGHKDPKQLGYINLSDTCQ